MRDYAAAERGHGDRPGRWPPSSRASTSRSARTRSTSSSQTAVSRATTSNELAREVLLFQARAEEARGDRDPPTRSCRSSTRSRSCEYTTVEVEHILVKTKAEAQDVYDQVTAPGSRMRTSPRSPSSVASTPAPSRTAAALARAAGLGVRRPSSGRPPPRSPGRDLPAGPDAVRLARDQADDKKVRRSRRRKASWSGRRRQIFNDWLTKQAEDQGVDVNPKYGALRRPDAARWCPITSTDPARQPASATPGAVPRPTP